MQFGLGGLNYLVDTPEAVAQAVRTRLLLLTEEWFLDTTEGTPFAGQVLGYGTESTRDLAIRERILGAQGVRDIVEYSSEVVGRAFTVTARIDTVYGLATIVEAL